MLIRNQLPYLLVFSVLFLTTVAVPYLSIWHFVDHRRYGAFPEEDHVSLAYVLGGNFMTRLLFVTHFKAILNHSDHFFRLHLITDSANREDIDVLLKTWNVTNCQWWFYNLEEYEKNVKWIPNSHYSKYYGLAKLLIPEIISDNVGKVMYVDIDIVFRSDIFYLWQKFRGFNESQSLGMIENLSDWYLNKDGKKSVWPALGRGFNAGIIMFDLDKMRERDWAGKWRAVANKYLRIHGKTTMSDQDIFNAYIYEHPEEIKELPCEYNYQLGLNTKSEELCDEWPLALHFNSQNKTVRKGYRLYNAIRKEVEGIDGSEVRRRKREIPDINENTNGTCDVYLPERNFRILPNSMGRMKETAELCLVTQFSKERLGSFMKNAHNWNHPISVAVYGNDSDLMDIANEITKLSRTNIALHMVFANSRNQKMSESSYPINFLRNVAMNFSNCNHFLLVDVDFMVLGDYDEIVRETKGMGDNQILVLPAFESVNDTINQDTGIPKTKAEIKQMYLDDELRMFHEKVWPSAHCNTNISKWIDSESIYTVPWAKNYEPYFIIRKGSCPLYDERFGGYGWNKVSQIIQMKMMNYTFTVSPTGFMMHLNHDASQSLQRWRRDSNYRRCLHELKSSFIAETKRELKRRIKKSALFE